jgi:hypothetical protein
MYSILSISKKNYRKTLIVNSHGFCHWHSNVLCPSFKRSAFWKGLSHCFFLYGSFWNN